MPPTAQIVLTVATSALRAGLRAAAGLFASFGNTIANAPINVGKYVGREIGKGVLRHVGARGVDFLLDLGKQAFEFNDALTRFGIAARISGPALNEVGAAIRGVSSETGVNANEVLRGARAYVDLAGAAAYTTEKMSLIARASQASGSDINDMATVVYALQHSLSIPNTQLEDTIGGLINLSKDGAVHFNQMAQELIGLAPVYAQFGITGRQGAIELAAQLEVVRTGFGSASEAGTGLLRLYRSIPQHAKLFEGAGVQIFKPGSRTDLLTMGEILKNIKGSRLEKDRPALIKAFGRGEAERSYQLLDKLLNEYQALEEAGHRNGVVQEDLATYTESAAGRMHIAMEKTKNAFAEALTPERVDQIVHGIEAIAAAMPGLFRAVGAVADAFGAFAHVVARTKQLLQGDSKYEDTDEERLLLSKMAGENLPGAMRTRLTPEQRARALAIKGRDDAYNAGMADIMGDEGDYGATDSSIRKAIIAVRRGYGGGANARHTPGELGAAQAAAAYLHDRRGEISPERYKRIESDVDEKAKAEAQADFTRQHIRPLIQEFANQLGDKINRAIQGKPINIDGNPVATAVGNATGSRRK